MKLEDMPTRALLDLHNTLAHKPAGPKSFKNKSDLMARIRALESSRQHQAPKVVKAEQARKAIVAEAPGIPKNPKGSGVGTLARRALIDPCGIPYEDVAMFVNHFIPGSKATAQSVSWYASRMRKEGIDVPKRVPLGSVCVWLENPNTCDGWLKDCGITKGG
jgi:hypothetical protein